MPASNRIAVCTYLLAAINLGVFALVNALPLGHALSIDSQVLTHPWSLLTYAFVHSGALHLAINVAFLLALGKWLESILPRRIILITYLAGALAGALAFAAINYVANADFTLCGASAAVLALATLAAGARRLTIKVLAYNVPFRHLAFVIIALICLSLLVGGNTAGDVAHLAGVAIGLLMHRFLPTDAPADAIIDKVHQSGYASLTPAERDSLFNASKKRR